MQPLALDIPDDLDSAWQLAHSGVRIAAAWASTQLAAPSEHRILNMGWSRPTGALLGRPAHGLSTGIRLADLSLVLSGEGELLRGRPLCGQTPASLLAWMRDQAVELGARKADLTLPQYFGRPPALDLDTPLAEVSLDASTRVGVCIARASSILRDLAAEHPGASEVRCWVRDFDLTVTLPAGEDRHIECVYEPSPEGGRRWAIWVSDDVEPPTLSNGEWVSGDRTGAVLEEDSLPAFGGERVIRDWLTALVRPLSHHV